MLDIQGIISALVSPSDADGNLDLGPIPRLIRFLLERGIDGFFVGGSAGEGFFLTVKERKHLAEEVVLEVQKKVPVIIHVGSMNYRDAMELSRHAGRVGADAISSVIPFYYVFSLQEVRDYYQAISEASGLPTIVYVFSHVANISSSDQNFMETILTIDRIYGIKFTSENIYQLGCLRQIADGKLRFYGGLDHLPLPVLAMRPSGLIGSNYNALPEIWVAIYRAFLNNDLGVALEMQNRLIYYMRKFRHITPNIRAKGFLRLRGIDVGSARWPQTPLKPDDENILRKILEELSEDPVFGRHMKLGRS